MPSTSKGLPYPSGTDVPDIVSDLQAIAEAVDTELDDYSLTAHNHGSSYIAPSAFTAKGDLLSATAASTVSKIGVGANGTVLTANSATSTGLQWANPSNVSLTTGVTGTLPVANGGTNITSYTIGDILYASASSTLTKLSPGGNGQVLTLSSGIPSWQNSAAGFVNPMTTIGDIIYGAASGSATRLAGITSSTRNFLGQTGTGTASQAPSWTPSTGTGSVVLATSPTLTTPNIGVASGTSFNSITGLSSTNPIVNGSVAVGTGTTVARADHVHPVDTSRAALASPTFTGTPAAPTAAAGTNTTQIATTAYAYQLEDFIVIALSDETTNITTGTAKLTWRAPFAMTLTQIPRSSLSTASTSGNPTVDINVTGATILGANKLSINANQKTSVTASTATTLSTTSIANDAEITFDIDTAGTGARGLKVTLYYRRS